MDRDYKRDHDRNYEDNYLQGDNWLRSGEDNLIFNFLRRWTEDMPKKKHLDGVTRPVITQDGRSRALVTDVSRFGVGWHDYNCQGSPRRFT